MGVREAFAKLPVPPVPPAKMLGGTAKTLAAVGDSPGSPGSPEKEREPDAAPLSPEKRRAWSDDLCRRLSAGVAHQSPPGLGSWDAAWEMVAVPSGRLLEVLADWERTGNEADQRAAIHAAEDVAIAWERAAHAWKHKQELAA